MYGFAWNYQRFSHVLPKSCCRRHHRWMFPSMAPAAAQALSKKEQILELFRTTEMKTSMDGMVWGSRRVWRQWERKMAEKNEHVFSYGLFLEVIFPINNNRWKHMKRQQHMTCENINLQSRRQHDDHNMIHISMVLEYWVFSIMAMGRIWNMMISRQVLGTPLPGKEKHIKT